MGRYTTVQIYSDSNPSMRSVPYDKAVASGFQSEAQKDNSRAAPGKAALPVRPEKVDNPSGSTAGAGSGEFHVYRAAREREKLRLQKLDVEEMERIEQEQFKKLVSENKTSEERKTEKRRKKRQRLKEAKLRKKTMKLNGVVSVKDDDVGQKHHDPDEFQYTPIHKESKQDTNVNL